MRRLFTLSLLIGIQSLALACTSFVSLGKQNQEGGVIIAKSRDSLALYERLAVRYPQNGIPYLGLFYNETAQRPYPYIAAGVNRAGLAVVQNEASSVQQTKLFGNSVQSKIVYHLLAHYKSVAQVLHDQKKLFANGLANFLLIADKKHAILVEIAPKKNDYQIFKASQNNGLLYHSNHYVLNGMKHYNYWYFESSAKRFARIKQLMQQHHQKITMQAAYRWLSDMHAGVNDSIVRGVTLASWLYAEPQSKPASLWLRLTSPQHHFAIYHLKLTKQFWKTPKAFIKPIDVKTTLQRPIHKPNNKDPYQQSE